LKRLMANAAFADLRLLAEARHADFSEPAARRAALTDRVVAIPADAVAPSPLINGQDLMNRGVKPGPAYKDVLDVLYTRQLDEELADRDAALCALDGLLWERGIVTGEGEVT